MAILSYSVMALDLTSVLHLGKIEINSVYLLSPCKSSVQYRLKLGIWQKQLCKMMKQRNPNQPQLSTHQTSRLRTIVSSPALLFPFVDLFSALCGIGMLESMLEPHLRETGASNVDIGFSFLLYGCCYIIGNMPFGLVCCYKEVTLQLFSTIPLLP